MRSNKPESNKELKCELCNRNFNSSHNYNQHLKAHASNDATFCKTCKKHFKALKDHIKNVHVEHQFECGFEGCEKSFAKKHGLDRHWKTHSDDFKSFQCPECLKMFSEKMQLERHYLVHLKLEQRTNFQCHQCHKYFNRKADVIRHTKTIHHKKLFSCDLCPRRRFGTKFEVLKHFNVLHLGVKSKRRSPPQKMSINDIMNRHFNYRVEPEGEKTSTKVEAQEEFCLNDEVSIDNKSEVEEETSSLVERTDVVLVCEPNRNDENNVIWECQRCNRIYENCNRLKLHNLRNHNWKCLKCNVDKNKLTTFHFREIFELHWITNHGDYEIPQKS